MCTDLAAEKHKVMSENPSTGQFDQEQASITDQVASDPIANISESLQRIGLGN
jgi:hypothetical protein